MYYDLPDLRLVAAIAESGSLTRAAAARIHLAPSSASHRLTQLEATLGVPLFARHARGLTPTPAGESLLRHARQVFAQLEQMHADLAPYASGLQ
jgi:DNA-binding transcriptional LysR family regulator